MDEAKVRAVLDRVYELVHSAIVDNYRGVEPESDALLDVFEEVEEELETLTDDDLGR